MVKDGANLGSGKDYVLQLRVKNGPMLRAMRLAGFETAAALSRACGATQSRIGEYLNLKRVPIHKQTGAWSRSIDLIATCLKALPEDLFPPQHIERALRTNKAEFEMSLDEIAALPASLVPQIEHHTPEDDVAKIELNMAILGAIETLSDRQASIIERVFGLCGREPQSITEIAEEDGLSRSRIDQIYGRALRNLRHPRRTKLLRDFAEP